MPKSDSKPGPNPKFVKLCQVICEELKRGIDKSYNKFYKLYNGKFKGLVIFKLKRILQRQPQKEEIQEVLTDFWSRAHKQNHFCDAKYEIYFINTLTRICLDVLKKVIKQRKIEENEIEISNDNFIEDDKFRILQTPVAELKKKEPLDELISKEIRSIINEIKMKFKKVHGDYWWLMTLKDEKGFSYKEIEKMDPQKRNHNRLKDLLNNTVRPKFNVFFIKNIKKMGFSSENIKDYMFEEKSNFYSKFKRLINE